MDAMAVKTAILERFMMGSNDVFGRRVRYRRAINARFLYAIFGNFEWVIQVMQMHLKSQYEPNTCLSRRY